MTTIRTNDRVPDGSRLEILMDSKGKPFVGVVRILDDLGNETRWTFDGDHPGPRQKTLRSPRVYGVNVRIQFVTDEEVEVLFAARIVKPGGDVHGVPLVQTVRGKKPQVARKMIFIRTKKS